MYKLEIVTSRMYIMFSDRYPEHVSFWRQMAAEQILHADLVKTLYKAEVQGAVNYNDGGVNEETLETIILFIERIIKKAENDMITDETALALSMEIESSLIDKNVYKSFTVQDAKCKHIPGKLFNGTRQHLQETSKMLARFSDK